MPTPQKPPGNVQTLPQSAAAPPVQELSNASGASAAASSQKANKVAPTPAELNNLVGQMQKKVSSISPELQFSVDKDSGKSIIKLTNRSTSEVVWQFPSEEALRVTRELDRFQKGLMLNRNA